MKIQVPAKDITVASYEIEVQAPPTPSPFRLYSDTSFWNKKLTTETIHANSQAMSAYIFDGIKFAGSSINTTQYSRPIYFVSPSTVRKPVHLLNQTGSVASFLLAGVPIPNNLVISAGSDGHCCIVDVENKVEYDFWKLKFNTTLSRWEASACGLIKDVYNSDGTQDRLSVWNTATATHLPLAGGTIMLSELLAGIIPHCVAVAIYKPKKSTFVWPAKSTDGWGDDPNAPEEGRRFRFPSDIVIQSTWAPIVKMLVTAIRDYGMVLMDKTGAGTTFYVEDPRQYGLDSSVLTPHLGGKAVYQLLGNKDNLSPQFPWKSLVAIA